MHEVLQCDVLVIGGGPAGSTASTLLARKGWRVLQLEKDSHPRFHIGESLLPCNLPILEELGVLDQVEAIGVLKRGADFPAMRGRYQTFRFRQALGQSPDHAYQVKREDFDRLLFDNARANGVDARERVCVESVTAEAPGSVQALARNADGTELPIMARYVVDASGRDTLLGKQFRLKRKNQSHQSAAIFAHFESVERRPGEDAGNISIYQFDQGWCWFIPLPEGLMSIGCVCWPEYLKQRRGSSEEFLIQTLQLMPDAWKRAGAARIRGEVRVTGNYSYSCSRMCGPGWIMAGDAWAFVDPVFSSGVYLAMHSGTGAATLVDASLRDASAEKRLQRDYDRRIRRGVRVFSWFIYRFNSPVMRALFAQPRNHWRVEEGMVSMLAGDVFDSAPVMRRVRAFKFIYAMASLFSWSRWRGELAQRRRQARVEFSGGTTPVDPA